MCASRQFGPVAGDGGPLVRGATEPERETATVLVVDDDPEIASLTAAYLKRLETDLTVLVETNPSAALSQYDDVDPDCVVSDYEMPEMDGLAVVDAVRDRDPAVPVVLFTATDDESVAQRARTEGVPFVPKRRGGFDELAARVATALAKRARDHAGECEVASES